MLGVSRMIWLRGSGASVVVALLVPVATAQAQATYHDHAVKIIVPSGPGGSYDLVGRHLADV